MRARDRIAAGAAVFPVLRGLWPAALVLLPVAALACPDAGDMAEGVELTLEGGAVARLMPAGDGLVVDETVTEDGEGYRITALHGLWVVEEVEIEGGLPDPDGAERLDWAGGLESLPAPEPGLEWSGVAEVSMDGLPPYARGVSVTIGAAETVEYGDCSYESWPVRVANSEDIGDFALQYDYLPLLGVAVLRAYEFEGEPPDRLTPLAIAPVTP